MRAVAEYIFPRYLGRHFGLCALSTLFALYVVVGFYCTQVFRPVCMTTSDSFSLHLFSRWMGITEQGGKRTNTRGDMTCFDYPSNGHYIVRAHIFLS